MINVSEDVKEVLRDGSREKEYIFTVYEAGFEWVEVGTYAADEVCNIVEEGEYKCEANGDCSVLILGKYDHVGIPIEIHATVPPNPPYGFEFSSSEYILPAQVIGDAQITIKRKNTVWNHPVAVLDNSDLVSESVKFDERMCSGSELKFGLCEGTSLEFQCFGTDAQMIKIGRRIQAVLQAERGRPPASIVENIPMGWFTVDSISRQASTGIIKVTAYNKLQSDYLDRDVTADILSFLYAGTNHTRSIDAILNFMLSGYHTEKSEWNEVECKLWRPQNIEDAIWCETQYHTIMYSINGGSTWNSYVPYTPSPGSSVIPSGRKWVVYAADFYYVPVDDDPQSTTHIYKYEGVNLPSIWLQVCPPSGDLKPNNLEIYYDFDPYSGYAPEGQVVINPMHEIYPSERLYGINENGGETFEEYATGIKTGNFHKDIAGYVGGLETSVCGYTAPVNIGEFSGSYPVIRVPLAIVVQEESYAGTTPPNPFNNAKVWAEVKQRYEEVYQALGAVPLPKMYRKKLSAIEETTISYDQLVNINSGITLRELQSAAFEVECLYGKLDRETDLFAGIELNNGKLYPQENLYPANTLLPMGTAERGNPSMYSKLWADEGNVRSFRYLTITYKTTENDGQGNVSEVEMILQRTVNANGTDDYDMSDNWIFKNLSWTAAQIGVYADAMVTKMQNIRWFPFEMWCAGLPYIEAGDEIEIAMGENTYTSYVLQRTLSGIQNLQDEMINGTLDIF